MSLDGNLSEQKQRSLAALYEKEMRGHPNYSKWEALAIEGRFGEIPEKEIRNGEGPCIINILRPREYFAERFKK